MLSSSTKNNVASKDCHEESSRANHWWFMDNMVLKTLSTSFLIHRTHCDINIKSRCNNLHLQSLKSVLNLTQWFTSAQSGASPNKLINADCRSDVFFLIARCAAGYQERSI